MENMSDKWEVVTSKKAKPKAKKEEPKPEEILSPHQFKNYSASLKQALQKEKKKLNLLEIPPKKGTNNNINTSIKKDNVQQLQANVSPSKKKTTITSAPVNFAHHKPKPKNIETGLASINIDDLINTMESYKATFINSHLLWLRRLSSYLSEALNVDTDPTFSGKSSLFPSIAIPKAIKDIIYDLFDECGESTMQYFFDQSLTTLAVDLSKNQPYNGHKILLQLIAFKWPNFCIHNLAKSSILLNSYLNRSSIGLTLLWSLGQGGFKDLTVGLRVWQDIMIPISDIKSYRKYILEYVDRILEKADNSTIAGLLQNEFFTIFDSLTGKSSNQKEYQKILNESTSKITIHYIRNNQKVSNIFLRLFMRLNEPGDTNLLYTGLLECMKKENDVLKIWKMNYKKHLTESNMLLTYLDRHWHKANSMIKNMCSFKVFLTEILNILDNLPSGKSAPENEIIESRKLILNLQDKASSKKSNGSSACPWILGSFILLLSIGGLIAYDTHIHGGVFAKSTVGTLLKDAGALPYVETAWTKSMSTSARGFKWAEKNVPIYAHTTCEFLKPYAELTRDVSILAWNGCKRGAVEVKTYIVDKSPLVINVIEQYVPGLPKKISDASVTSWDMLSTTSKNVYNTLFTFFKTQVFVGKLSPENLCNAFNQTQIAAAQYYSWFHQKVDNYAKIQ